jgi:pyruvate-ferredoxin/flavodoxin oxidoreductase
MDRIDVFAAAEPGATFLLNAPFSPEEIHRPRQTQEIIVRKKPRFFVIDGYAVARAAGPWCWTTSQAPGNNWQIRRTRLG